MISQLQRALTEGRVLICAGPGGVGKTTVSAALAVAAAQQGRRTLVMTIDPARRLADSLGLAQLGDTPQPVELPAAEGRLWAMMLDVRGGLDRFVGEEVADASAARSLTDHRLYRLLADAMHGMQEYVAVQRLYALHRSGEFDLIVVDTPPATHALDFLDAPTRLARFFDRRFIKWLLPGGAGGRFGGRLLKPGAALVKTLGALLGGPFVEEMMGFFAAAEPVLQPLHDHGEAVLKLLGSDATRFLLITRPEPRRVEEAKAFEAALAPLGQRAVAFVLNRAWPAPPPLDAEALVPEGVHHREALLDDLRRFRDDLAARARADAAISETLGAAVGAERVIPIADLGLDAHDLDALTHIAESLLAG